MLLKNVKEHENIMNNIPPSILNKIGTGLYRIPNHPLCIIKEKVFEYFGELPRIEIDTPYVSIENNFDRLRVPKNHPSRRPTDTFYRDKETCLRTHMTSYLYPIGKSHNSGTSQLKYITCGDVYRKDAIDATHYPVFHQIDAFCIEPVDVEGNLRHKLSGLIEHLFGKQCDYEFLEDSEHDDVYFPFTVDSLEVNVKIKDENGQTRHLEVLGAGTVHPDIMKELGLENQKAWAFGLGVERLAMVMFDVPDIRLFWSQDPRFLNQFKAGEITKFKPYSKYEVCYKDVSFYVSKKFSYNDMCTIARDVDTDSLIESISLIDEFDNKGRVSLCYRITYRSMERTLANAEVDKIQQNIRQRLTKELEVEIR